ncbi:aarF domain-containing kinase [Sporothrix schenckii 1099-18]|uniref:AarF domain-containing kinase n=1 Tax=Sporothrix schenckii 1099-18 TaxID=1397361 RepID=A0A0F2LU43_SPOSC|nr:aarF domain-containing kinase [Sporothrix schenckii 1099-18]KJR80384.1 aarF domain-containing kinase [Sporothrix schenckii 1099-18]
MRFLDLAADFAAVVSASRNVASKHAALRSRQIGASFVQNPRDPKRPSPESQEAPKPEDIPAEGGATPAEADVAAQASPASASASPSEPVTEKPPVPAVAPVRQAAQEIRNPDIQEPETAGSPEEPVLPTFIHRAQLRTSRPPGALNEVRRKAAEAAGPSGGPSKLHPLDPRLKQTPRPPPAGPSQAVQDAPVAAKANSVSAAVAESIEQGVFSKREEQPPNEDPSVVDTTLDVEGIPKTEPTVDASPGTTPEAAPQAEESPGTRAEETQQALPENETLKAEILETPSLSTARATPLASIPLPTTQVAESPKRAFELKESKVPATRLSRIWNYSGLAAGMLGGALTESISRGFGGGSGDSGSVMLSPGNLERLVSRLSRMRGAALKLGQMMSFQDAKMLPAPLQEVLQRVQDSADYMPAWQRDRVLASDLGADWRDLFGEFEEKPLAAASIGQVHRATLRSNGAAVAVKIQFPGVADSINSDLDNLGILLTATRMLPKGLYLDKTIANARTELAWECDYLREAACAQRFRRLLDDARETGVDGAFVVPDVFGEASGKQVLTMSFMDGVGVTKVAHDLSQEQRDWIGTQILRLCLLEITQFHFMQTDPNWTNFLYNAGTNKLELLDFGASREYPAEFVDQYVRLLQAASQSDLEGVQALSRDLGYLTGHESRAMLDAHTQSVMTLAEPFRADAPEIYDFQDQTITDRVRSFIPVMVRERLTPPPEETYSLHRKLSGAFLLCARLGSRVACRGMFEDSLKKMGLA